jgi:hypothetical protein
VTPEPVTPAAGEATPPASADSFAAEREQLEARARSFQARADKAEAELTKLKEPKPDPTQNPVPLTAEGVLALLNRDRELTEARSTLKTEFPSADPALLKADYASVEAMRAAVEDSHKRIEAIIAPRVDSESQALLARYVEKYGALPDAPGAGEGTPKTGLPTKAELRGYGIADLNKFIAEHGEDTFNRIIKGE